MKANRHYPGRSMRRTLVAASLVVVVIAPFGSDGVTGRNGFGLTVTGWLRGPLGEFRGNAKKVTLRT